MSAIEMLAAESRASIEEKMQDFLHKSEAEWMMWDLS